MAETTKMGPITFIFKTKYIKEKKKRLSEMNDSSQRHRFEMLSQEQCLEKLLVKKPLMFGVILSSIAQQIRNSTSVSQGTNVAKSPGGAVAREMPVRASHFTSGFAALSKELTFK